MANDAAKYIVTSSQVERSQILDKMISSGALPPTDNISSAEQIRKAIGLGDLNELKNALKNSFQEIQSFEKEFKSAVATNPSNNIKQELKNEIGF
jgi:hypothetical protein